MYDNKTILKLHFDGVSIRQIAERSKKSRNTISRIISLQKKSTTQFNAQCTLEIQLVQCLNLMTLEGNLFFFYA